MDAYHGSRVEAKALGYKWYFTGAPCPHGHLDRRAVSNSTCFACTNAKALAYQKANRDKRNAAVRAYYLRNIEAERARSRTKAKRYWDRKATNSLARSRQMPKWANKSAVMVFYIEAARLTAETGIPHEVDHIVPLRGAAVCGLHIESNLQVLPRAANRAKSNSWK